MEPKIRVLFVEDHSDTLLVTEVSLMLRGFEIITAKDVQSGIEAGTHKKFDVLLCDIGLPDGRGWDVLKELRKIKSFGAIALTAYSSQEEKDRQRAEGFDLSMSKPFDSTKLTKAIQDVYKMHKEREQQEIAESIQKKKEDAEKNSLSGKLKAIFLKSR